MAELGKAYVQIVPSAKGISGSISQALGGEAVSAGKSSGESLGGSLIGSLKGVIAAAGVGAFLKQSLDAGGAVQQSFGGLDTLYGDASGKAKEFATEAAAAGISANTWAEQAVSFGAALKQSLGGDATQAAEVANKTILAMADNSAKMGTDIQSIQNAYQGFAKQNYTMLDNLKLGYGGTKTEMERLIADASQMTDVQEKLGVTIDANDMSFANIANAISVVQENLGIAGTAAEEASTTFTGSFAAMQASFNNLLADMSLGNDITNSLSVLAGSVQAFLMNNLIPMLANIATSIPNAIISNLPAIQQGISTAWESVKTFLSGKLPELAEMVTEGLGDILSKVPDVSSKLVEWINSFSQTLSANLPTIIGNIQTMLGGLFQTIMANLPAMLGSGLEIITAIANMLMTNVPILIQSIGEMIPPIISGVVAFLIESLPTVLDTILNILSQLPDYIASMISALFPMIISLLTSLLPQIPILINTVIFELLPKLLAFIAELGVTITAAVLSLLANLIAAIAAKLPEIVTACVTTEGNIISGLITGGIELVNTVIQLIQNVLDTITGKFEEFVTKGKEIIQSLASGIPQALSDVITAVQGIITGITDKFKETDWLSTGIDIVKGIAKGITDGAINILNAIEDVCSNALDAVKGFFGIASPSKLMADEVGKYIPAGIAVGIEDNMSPLTKAMNDVETEASTSINASIQRTTGSGYSSLKSGAASVNQIGDISINVYAKESQSPKAIALEVEEIITNKIRREGMAFA